MRHKEKKRMRGREGGREDEEERRRVRRRKRRKEIERQTDRHRQPYRQKNQRKIFTGNFVRCADLDNILELQVKSHYESSEMFFLLKKMPSKA